MKIGFIGMGIMGSRMTMNLLEGGHDLTISNRTREKSQLLLDKGARWAESPVELAAIVDKDLVERISPPYTRCWPKIHPMTTEVVKFLYHPG